MQVKKPLLGLKAAEIAALLDGEPAYRSRQIYKRMCDGASTFDSMSELPEALRRKLAEKYCVYDAEVPARLEDGDGTAKIQIRLADGALVEAVLLVDQAGRKTACLSTQAGCPAGCVFCRTGSLGFRRNLSAAEIIQQYFFLNGRNAAPGSISNIVIMGMGEPLLNLAELRRALDFFEDGLGMSRRRITVSTCGVIDGIRDLTENGPAVRLALSLTAGDQALRERLMPLAKANPLPALKEALAAWQETYGQRLTLEAVLLKGINTSLKAAADFAAFAKGLDVVANLIPWNRADGLAFEGRPLETPSRREAEDFAAALEKAGVKTTMRRHRGRSVAGACGQLGGTADNRRAEKAEQAAAEAADDVGEL